MAIALILMSALYFHRDWIWSLLTQGIPDDEQVPASVLDDLEELETFLLRFLSVPVPVPGKTKIEVSFHFQNSRVFTTLLE